MEKYLGTASVEELNTDLSDLVLEMQFLHDIVHKMHTTSSVFENTIIFPSVDLESRYKKFKLEFQFYEDTPVVSMAYSLGNSVYALNSGLLDETFVSDDPEKILENLFRLEQIAGIMAHDQAESSEFGSDDDSFD